MKQHIYYNILAIFIIKTIKPNVSYHLTSNCQNILGKQNFSEVQFLGVWYLQQSSISTKDECIKYNFKNASDIFLTVSNNSSSIDEVEFQQYSHSPYLTSSSSYFSNVIYVVLDTDYDNYLLLWKCKLSFHMFTKSAHLVLTRSRQPNKEILNQAYTALTNGKIRKKLILYRIKQNNCDN